MFSSIAYPYWAFSRWYWTDRYLKYTLISFRRISCNKFMRKCVIISFKQVKLKCQIKHSPLRRVVTVLLTPTVPKFRDAVQEYSPSICGVTISNAAVKETLFPLMSEVTWKFGSMERRFPSEFLHSNVREDDSVPPYSASHKMDASSCCTFTSMGSTNQMY